MISLFQKKKKKNVIFLMLDQFRHDFLPHNALIQKAIKKGVFFDNLITYAPYTVGAIHAVMSGMYGTHNGANSYYGSDKFKPEELATMAEYFKTNGYKTYSSVLSGITYPKKAVDHFDVYDENKQDPTKVHKDIIKKAKEEGGPFYIYFQSSIIHADSMKFVLKKYDDFSEEFFSQMDTNRKNYGGSIDKMGTYVDELLKYIKELGIYDDTMILIFTDHGSSMGERKGEKAYGSFVYDYTIKTWCSFLNTDFPAKKINTQIRGIDILPTMMDMFGFKKISYPLKIQGSSLLPLMKGKKEEDRVAFSETAPLGGSHPSPDEPIVKAVRDGTWKYIFNTVTEEDELYNIKEDPKEEKNLVEQEPEQASRLKKELVKYMSA